MAYQDYLTYLGHATVLIEVEDVRVMTDPVLRPGAAMLHRMPGAADIRDYTDVDVVVMNGAQGELFRRDIVRRPGQWLQGVDGQGA